jgi:hypothetical protein
VAPNTDNSALNISRILYYKTVIVTQQPDQTQKMVGGKNGEMKEFSMFHYLLFRGDGIAQSVQ